MHNRTTSHDVSAIGGLPTTSSQFLVMFKNLATIPGIVCDRTIIVQRRTMTSYDVILRRETSEIIVRHISIEIEILKY